MWYGLSCEHVGRTVWCGVCTAPNGPSTAERAYMQSNHATLGHLRRRMTFCGLAAFY